MISDGALIGVALGLGLGARHALEPDHLAAVSALAADHPGGRRGLLIGALWGVGHTVALLACGLAVTIAAVRIPARVSELLEIVVATMLVSLGARAIYLGRLAAGKGCWLASVGPPQPVDVAPRFLTIRPLLVGAIHGLAGSGALVALATATLPTPAAQVAFLGLFGLGSIAAMSAISGFAGWPLARLARRPTAAKFLLGIAGTASVVFGILWALSPVQRLLR